MEHTVSFFLHCNKNDALSIGYNITRTKRRGCMNTIYNAIDSNQNTELSRLGKLLKLSMQEQSISMRGLSKLTNISAATISRIVNGKQVATVEHLIKIADTLDIPIEKVLETVGVTNMQQDNSHNHFITLIEELVSDFNIDFKTIVPSVKKELDKLELYAKTKEGAKIIIDDFLPKLESVDGAGPTVEKMKQFYYQFCSTQINENKRVVIGSALLYFILTMDVIPDYLFPIGYLDEAIAVKLVEKKLQQMTE